MKSEGEVPATRVVQPLLDAVSDLLGMRLTALSDNEITDLLSGLECVTRKLETVKHRVIVEATERSIPANVGAGDTKRFLMQTLRLSSREAARRYAAARSLGTWHDLNGGSYDPQLFHTAAAQSDGEISSEHATRIAAMMKRIPYGATSTEREAAEKILADFARTGSPDDIPAVGEAILAHLDPDGNLTADRDRQRMRGITIGSQRPDGMSTIHGEITPTLRGLLDAVMAKCARPGMNNPEDPESPFGDCEYVDRNAMVAAAARDTRTAAQRTHDGLLALLSPGVRVDALGSHRGLPVAAILTMSVDDVEKAAGVATTATGGVVPMSEALALAEQAQPFLMVFDHQGMPLHVGRAKRLATPAQRMALIASVRGCSRPGCDAPASLCAIHHVTEYAKGGATDIENLTLACDRCHAMVNDGPNGWKTVVLGSDSAHVGRTAWIAPAHIDPTRTPRVNHRHHPGELLAQALSHLHDRDTRQCRAHRAWLSRRERPLPPVPTTSLPAVV
ncbi:HNH endonuclease signature motif containing protein [Nocardia brasiliensis]|uniref:HNH endonuclease signature motif containing protein n=1 Tax=Nocardia brasiliensis TaxID=37326 RepID=UPI002454CCF3|nr:HNH endonuclease signature motif containing protein [Nocardia brasiliensis]